MSLNIVIDADVAGASRKIETFAKDSRIALTNLSLVVQDLPYGFLGIQNNLPFLAKSFSDLSTASGGTLGALKELGKSLIGPAGLFLAFSTVTSAITFAVQKYGSLGNAVDALFSKNSALLQRQNELNKSIEEAAGKVAGESAKIQILVNTLNDLSLSNEKRLAAYVGLKKISPDIVAGITKENALTKEGVTAINDLVKARLNYLQVRAREIAITNQLNKIEEQRLANEQEYTKLLSNRGKAQKAYNATNKELYNSTATFGAILENKELAALAGADAALRKNRDERIDLFNASNDLLNQLKPLIEGTSQYESRVETLNEQLKESQKRTKELADAQKKLNKELSAEDLARKARYAANKLQEQADKNRLRALAEEARLLEKITKETFKQADKAMKADAESFNLSFQKLEEVTLPLEESRKKLVKNFTETKAILEAVFFNPMQELFTNFFETGKFALKEFGDNVLKEIQRIVARIIASKIIELLANILVPGGGAALQASGLSEKGGSILSNILSGRNIGRPRPDVFNQGAINLGGQVALVLRGQDLVASINRTNTTINRVG